MAGVHLETLCGLFIVNTTIRFMMINMYYLYETCELIVERFSKTIEKKNVKKVINSA